MLLESFRSSQMETPAANWIQLFVKHLANLVVGKNKRLTAVGSEQLRGHRFIKRIEKFVLVEPVGRRYQFVDRKSFTEHRRGAQGLVTFCTDAIQTISYRLLHALRYRQIGQVTTLPLSTFSPHRT